MFYLLFILAFVMYLWYTFATVYHFVRFGIGTHPKRLAFVFLTGSFILFVAVIYTYSQVQWPNISPTNFIG